MNLGRSVRVKFLVVFFSATAFLRPCDIFIIFYTRYFVGFNWRFETKMVKLISVCDAFLPDLGQWWIFANAERLRVRADGVDAPIRMELGAAYSLHVFQCGNGHEAWSVRIILGMELQTKVEEKDKLVLHDHFDLPPSARCSAFDVANENRWSIRPQDVAHSI